MRQIAQARASLSAACVLEQRQEVVEGLQRRAEEVLKWAQLVEQAQLAKAKAAKALKKENWETVMTLIDEAMGAFEEAGEMDQVYQMEDLKKRSLQSKARADLREKGLAAVARGEACLQDGELSAAGTEAQTASDAFAAAALPMPDALKSLLERISQASAEAEAAAAAARQTALREQAQQAVEDAEACIKDCEFDDARLAIVKARSLFEKALCLDQMAPVLVSLEAMVARGEGREACLQRARAAHEACELHVQRASALTQGQEKRAVLISARDECFTAIAGFHEACEQDMSAKAKVLLADIEQQIQETNTTDEANAAMVEGERLLAAENFEDARKQAALAMVLLAKGGHLGESEKQVTDLEDRIRQAEARHRALTAARDALKLCAVSLELARVPGKQASLDDARAQLLRSEQLLSEAQDPALQQEVKDMQHRIDLTAQWQQELEDGEAELADARKHLAAKELEAAHDCAHTALQVFERLEVEASAAAAKLVLTEVGNLRQADEGLVLLREAEDALADDELDQALTQGCAARDLLKQAGAAEALVRAEAVVQRVRDAHLRSATLEQGGKLLAQAEACMDKADLAGGRRALGHARAAFQRVAVHDAEQEMDAVEHKLDAMDAALTAVREAKSAIGEATRHVAKAPPGVMSCPQLLDHQQVGTKCGATDAGAAKYAIQRAHAALDRGVDALPACMGQEAQSVREALQDVEKVVNDLLAKESAHASVSALGEQARAHLTHERLPEADAALALARKTLDKAADAIDGTVLLQQIVDLQEQARVVRQEVVERQEGERLLAEAEASLRAGDFAAAETQAQSALLRLNKAQGRLRVDALQQQTHRLILRIGDMIGRDAKRQQALASLAAAEKCVQSGDAEAAGVQCADAREALGKAGALNEHEGQVLAVEACVSQLKTLSDRKAQVLHALDAAGRALDVVRVKGKRDEKLAEAKLHLENVVTLHQGLIQVRPPAEADCVRQIGLTRA